MHSVLSRIGGWVKTRPVCRTALRLWRWLTTSTPLDDIPVLERLTIAETYRRLSLRDLAWGAVGMGLLLALTAPENAPSFALLSQLPGWPWLWGSILVLFGALQAFGLRYDRRTISMIGCNAAFIWYLLFALSFTLTWGNWVYGYARGSEELNPSIYQVIPYLLIASHHLRALRTLRYYLLAQRRQEERKKREGSDAQS